jgi:hypothetical protein
VNIDPEEFHRRYDELSDEALLSIKRAELVDLARQYYDDELARRGLQAQPEPGIDVAEMDEELVTAATFLYPDEAKLARALLQSASIRCYLDNEHTLSIKWISNYAFGGLRLMAPISAVDDAREILGRTWSNDELISLAEAEPSPAAVEDESFSRITAADPTRRGRRWLLALAILFFAAPDVYRLYLFVVF